MWTINTMKQDETIEIADLWKYPELYSFYNLTEDIEDYNEIINPKKGKISFSIHEGNTLIGYFCIEMSNNSVNLRLEMNQDLTSNGKVRNF